MENGDTKHLIDDELAAVNYRLANANNRVINLENVVLKDEERPVIRGILHDAITDLYAAKRNLRHVAESEEYWSIHAGRACINRYGESILECVEDYIAACNSAIDKAFIFLSR